jgi:hypothetical protein
MVTVRGPVERVAEGVGTPSFCSCAGPLPPVAVTVLYVNHSRIPVSTGESGLRERNLFISKAISASMRIGAIRYPNGYPSTSTISNRRHAGSRFQVRRVLKS